MTTAHARQMGRFVCGCVWLCVVVCGCVWVGGYHFSPSNRSKEIQDISKSIVELAEIMNDLRVLVEDQGTILDRIDYNIEQVEEMTEESLTIIQDSHEQQKVRKRRGKGRKKDESCWLTSPSFTEIENENMYDGIVCDGVSVVHCFNFKIHYSISLKKRKRKRKEKEKEKEKKT